MARTIAALVSQIPAAHWQVIEQFVRDAVTDAMPSSKIQAKRMLTACTRLVYWAWQSAGYDLDRQVIFRRDVISSFVAVACQHYAVSTQASYRSLLFSMSATLLTGPLRPVPTAVIPRSYDASEPYTGDEIRLLRLWAANQATTYRQVNATVLLALGLGAGLSTREIIHLRCADVQVDDQGVLVHVTGERERLVPVLGEWEAPLAALCQAAIRPTQPVFGSRRTTAANPNLVTAFLEDATDAPVRVKVQRLRATWVVGHLAAGVPAPVLARAAGLTTTDGLTRFLKYVPDIDVADVRAQMRRALTTARAELP